MGYTKELHEKSRSLPEHPGVYQFLDSDGKIIYIGKAKNLRKRVSSYFSRKTHDSFKIGILVQKTADLKFIEVGSEPDALLLENNLIKKHQPRYNILLKDDKSFPWICIRNEPFPRVFSTRTLIKDGSEYYGPYTSAYAVKVLLNLIRQIYPLRNCRLPLSEEKIGEGRFKVCLEYHIGNCKGPCEGKQDEKEYLENISQIREIIKGNLVEVIRFLKREMEKRAERFQFEQAEKLKQKIEILSRHQSKSTIVNSSINDVDVFSIVSEDHAAYVNYIKVVRGAIIQAHTVELKKRLDEENKDLLIFAITDLRNRLHSASKEMIVPFDISEYYPDCKVTIPQRGDKKKLLELSERNARSYRLEKKKRQSDNKTIRSGERTLRTVQQDLRLKELPVHIECFDNSNIQGSDPVAACVVFRNGIPSKREYRHYHIKGVSGINDFASMEEVVFRRYARLIKEGEELPQLVVIDGGKGQLNAALKSLEKLQLRGTIAVIGIAKKLEEIYFPEDPVPLYIDKSSESLKLIQHLRNEAHRFGITFHRQKRSSKLTRSSLDSIPGIGIRTIEMLYSHFSSLEKVRTASQDELERVIGKSLAEKVKRHFQG